MRVRVGVVCVAVMLLPLAALGGSSKATAPTTRVRKPTDTLQLVRLRDHPHPCTPYAGCDIATLRTGGGSQAP